MILFDGAGFGRFENGIFWDSENCARGRAKDKIFINIIEEYLKLDAQIELSMNPLHVEVDVKGTPFFLSMVEWFD